MVWDKGGIGGSSLVTSRYGWKYVGNSAYLIHLEMINMSTSVFSDGILRLFGCVPRCAFGCC